TTATAFSTPTSNPSTFTPTQSKSYAIKVVVSGNGQNGTANTTVNAICAAATVTTPIVLHVNGASPGATIFAGAAVQLATSATSVVSLVRATPHFGSIHRATGTPPFPALDPTLAPSAPEPTIVEGTDEFPVPFYLATPVSVRVQVNSAVNGSCASFGFVSAT